MSHLARITTGLFCLLLISQWGCSLGIRQDYVLDRDMIYSADDPFVRGAVYRAHIGHDGHFYNCDNEESKRYSPFIHWRARPCDSQSCAREIRELKQSYHDAVCRWKMGSCQICPQIAFPPGAGYGVETVALEDVSPATAPPELAIPPAEPMPEPLESQGQDD